MSDPILYLPMRESSKGGSGGVFSSGRLLPFIVVPTSQVDQLQQDLEKDGFQCIVEYDLYKVAGDSQSFISFDRYVDEGHLAEWLSKRNE